MPSNSIGESSAQLRLFRPEIPSWYIDDTTRAIGLAGVQRARETLRAARISNSDNSASETTPAPESSLSIGERWIRLAGVTDKLARGDYQPEASELAVYRLDELMGEFDPGFVGRFVGTRTRVGQIREREGRRLQMVELALADVSEVYGEKTAAWQWIEQPVADGIPFEQHLLETPGFNPFRHELLVVYRHSLMRGQLEAA